MDSRGGRMSAGRVEPAELDRFFDAVLSLQNREECGRFFEDVATIGELRAMVQRMQVAQLLDSGMKYADVAEHTGASPATISRVSRCLSYGADGYRLVIERLKEDKS